MRNRKAGAKSGATPEGKSSEKASGKSKEEKPAQEAPKPPRVLVAMQWFAVAVVMIMPVFVIGFCYYKWGPNYFLPEFMISLKLTSDDWKEIFKNRTLVMIGGPHRGGTTVLWDALRKHGKIADFGDERESGLDFSEGVFAQAVYPAHGVGNEFSREDQMDGVGRYALRPESYVHRTAEHETVTVENQIKVLNRWGYLWDLTDKPVLLEKSPVNAVMSTFLQALFNANNEAWKPTPPDFAGAESFVKFIFITRDPLANCYAHRKMSFNSKEPLERLLKNWLAVHEYLHQDIPGLQHVYRLNLEVFEQNPEEEVTKIWKWLGLEIDETALAEVKNLVQKGQNVKYVVEHCKMLTKNPKMMEGFLELADMYNDRVLALDLGYDLKSKYWTCEFLKERQEKITE